jgi:hypothetical protein
MALAPNTQHSYVIHFNDEISKTLHGPEISEVLGMDASNMPWEEIRARGLEVKDPDSKLRYLLETLDPTLDVWYSKPTTKRDPIEEAAYNKRSWAGYGMNRQNEPAKDLPENPAHVAARLAPYDPIARMTSNEREELEKTVKMNVDNHMKDCAFANSIPNVSLYERVKT